MRWNVNWHRFSTTGRTRSAAIAGGRCFSYAALAGALFAPGLWYGPTVDAAAFVLVGSGIRGGAMPYRDTWDDKPPGLYLMNAASQAGLPWLDRWLVCWLVSVALTVVAAVILDALLRPRIGSAMAWLATLVATFFVASYPVALGGGYAETFALPFVLAALLVSSGRERRLRDAALTGLLLGAACLVTLQAVTPALAIGLATGLGPTLRDSARRLAALAVGGVAIPLLVAGWLLWGGAGSQAWDAVVHYNAAYRQNGQALFWPRLLLAVALVSALVPSVVAQLLRWLRRADPIDRVAAACVAWIPLSLAFFVYGQHAYMHYLILLAPALVIVGAPSFVRLSGRLRAPEAGPRRIAVVAKGSSVALFVVAMLWGAQWPGSAAAITDQWHQDETAAASWIRANTPAAATMFVWGDHSEVYLATDRSPACPYVFLDPLITQGYWSPQATDGLLARWRSNPPAIVVETPAAVPLFSAAASAADDPRTFDTLDPLRAFVRDNYRFAHTDGAAGVWLLK